MIVIDECHRGSAADDSAWRVILEYFSSATHVGLTATPKETKDVSSIYYFGDPVYSYTLKQGIEDGFLAPYKVVRIDIDKDVQGWRPTKGQTDKHGELIEDRVYNLSDMDRTLVLEKRTELVAKKITEFLVATDPYAKTIVFCDDIDHAERMRQALVNLNPERVKESRKYVMRITGDSRAIYGQRFEKSIMIELLNLTSKALCRWLEDRLTLFGEGWWKKNVIDRLTFSQQRVVEERRIDQIGMLDMAALLRVLDQNWHELSGISPLPKECRGYVKELMNVRNRWAHAPSVGLGPRDTYRDADTLSLLLEALNIEGKIIEKIEKFKSEAHARMAPGAPSGSVAVALAGVSLDIAPKPTPADTKFVVGQLVQLRSNMATVFPIIEVIRSSTSEVRYRVFEGGARPTYYESQIQAIEDVGEQRKFLSAAELSAMMSAVQLSSPTASALYSLNSGRVRFVPYQYRPVFKLIRADRPRLLIADEVGVGKTIEAGLILKELQARHDIKSVLIICPKALVAERKWELEMKRFGEQFTALDGQLLRHCVRETHLNGEWPMQYEKAILPFSLFDSELLYGKKGKGKANDIGLLNLDPPPKFDLIIVDEAHHIRNSETLLHESVKYFSDNAEAVIFLSATPVQLGREDLYTLLNVLRPDVVIDPASFEQMAEPNKEINSAVQACRRGEPGWESEVKESLRAVAATSWGREVLNANPGFQHIYDSLESGDSDEVMTRVKTTHALEELYTFSALINRTKRRDIGEFTTRNPETLSTDFTPDQKLLHDELLDLIRRILARLHGNQNVKFMMTTISRQAASCLYGLAPTLEDILRGKLDRLEAEEIIDSDSVSMDFDFVGQIRSEIESLIDRAKRLDSYDPKANAFLKVVVDKIAMAKNKVLLFSTFRHTLRYLVGKLEHLEIRYGLVHGGISDEERTVLRHRFSLPKDHPEAIDVLLSSEVGCEGLDFQFCDCLVNYDLPWNPMRIEQRIGRIDRYGQSSEAVAIFNLITPGTIDAEIYNRCLSRIGVFNHAIGGSEEILGSITKELHSIADSFSLSEDQQCERLQQLADNKIRQIEEERKLEERQGELFGLNIATASWEHKLKQSRNFWLEPDAIALAVSVYLKKRLGKEQEYLLGDKSLKTLRLSQEARETLLEDYKRLPRSSDPTSRAWEKWLKGTIPTLSVTFDQECAVENDNAFLLSLGHPLIRQASLFLEEPEAVVVQFCAAHASVSPGIYPFAIYRWSRLGVRRDEELVAVSENSILSENLLDLMQIAIDAQELELPSQSVWDSLDDNHHKLWLQASTMHAEDNRQLVGVRIQSVTASYNARVALLNDQIHKATNPKIHLMKQSELERAQTDYRRRIEELRRAAESCDIKATPVIFGVIKVEAV